MTESGGRSVRAGFTAAVLAILFTLGAGKAGVLGAQEPRIRDLTLQDQTVPVRLVGYGLVIGLNGTGDRMSGYSGGGQTVQSIANLLRQFDIEVPAELIRSRNVAAVLVTAEVSPFLRPGGRFDVQVSSLGDAQSLRGGVLWMTPLVYEAGGPAVATVQGPVMVSDGGLARNSRSVETTARIPNGGLLEFDLPRPSFASISRLLLTQPDLGTATRIATAINTEIGPGTAQVEDPGSILLNIGGSPDERAALLARIGDIRVEPDRTPRVVIDSRDGTVVAGGDISVAPATVSHGLVTLTVGSFSGEGAAPGVVQMPAGTSVLDIAAVLHGLQTPPMEIAAILEALHRIGALTAEVVIR